MGQAWLFNGTSHWIDADAISTQDSSFVISCWIMNTTRTTDFAFKGNPGFWHVTSQGNELAARAVYQIGNPTRDMRWTPDPIPIDGNYHRFTWVFDGLADTLLFYFDGDIQPATFKFKAPGVEHFYTGHPINPNQNTDIGILGPNSFNAFDLMDGPADEFRVSEKIHSNDWIKTELRNQRYAQTFYIFGAEEQLPPVSVLDPPVPVSFEMILGQNHPNPFNSSTRIEFEIGVGGPVRLQVFDVAGREVARVFDRSVPEGVYWTIWNGRDQRGVKVRPGVYFYRLETPQGSMTKKSIRIP